MNSRVLIGGLLLVSGCAARSADEHEVVHIQLKNIWAHNMPGTRDVRELEPDVFGESAKNLSREEIVRRESASLFFRVGSALDFMRKGQVAGNGFAVRGVGKDALSNAYAVLVKGKKPRQSFSAGVEISLVFFSHLCSRYVHLDHVERRNRTIAIAYRFVPHETKQMTAHFALIPLGKLPAGKYQVEMVHLPLEEKYVSQGIMPVDPQMESRIVCQPFSFTVAKQKTAQPGRSP